MPLQKPSIINVFEDLPLIWRRNGGNQALPAIPDAGIVVDLKLFLF
jgi:hypothetical protein